MVTTITTWRGIFGLWLAVMFFLPSGGAAQEDVMTLKDLVESGGLRLGDAVDVFDASSRVFRGDVGGVSSTVLTVWEGRTRRRIEVPAGDVRKIVFRDSLASGMLWGFAVGFVSVPIACKGAGLSAEKCTYAWAYYGFPGIAVTTVVGAIVDSKVHKTVHIKPPQPGVARVSVFPMFSDDGLGARMSVSW